MKKKRVIYHFVNKKNKIIMGNSTKYKVGDKVRIKSLDWYNQYKDVTGCVFLHKVIFSPEMAVLCGKIVTIQEINFNESYGIGESNYAIVDDMIECKVNETPAEESASSLLAEMKKEYDDLVQSAENLISRLKQAQQTVYIEKGTKKLTKQQFREKFKDVKVFVNGKSKEIQQQLFKADIGWAQTGSKEILRRSDIVFLFIEKITRANIIDVSWSCNMKTFTDCIYKEVTADEILDVEIVDDEYEVKEQTREAIINAWLARDEDGSLYLHYTEPGKIDKLRCWVSSLSSSTVSSSILTIPSSLFPSIKWTDEKPTEVEVQIKIKE